MKLLSGSQYDALINAGSSMAQELKNYIDEDCLGTLSRRDAKDLIEQWEATCKQLNAPALDDECFGDIPNLPVFLQAQAD